jgi:hypothetical protein
MKSGTIFDLIEEDLPEGKEGFIELAARAPQPKDKSYLNNIKDYAKTFLKGSVEGISRLGRIMGPTYDHEGKSGSQKLEEQTDVLDYLLPTEEGYGQRSIRRGLKEAPTMLATPGAGLGTLSRSMLAGFLGEGAKDLGLPEWAQTAAELTAFMGPDITKKIISSGSNKEIIDAAKKLGMTDEQIAPLVQSEFKQKWLSKLAPKTGSTQDILSSTKSGLSKAYTTLQDSPAAKALLSPESEKSLINSLIQTAEKMPSAVRNKIREDAMDLVKRPITGESLMNFYADINHYLGENAKQLSLFKVPIKEAIKAASPELAKDFDLVNKLYGKYSKISSKLKPSLTDQVVRAAEALGVMGGAAKGILFGDYSLLVGALGEKLARKVAQNMLLNPRYQQLSKKMAIAINHNKYALGAKTVGELKDLLEKDNPDAAKDIQKMTEEEFKTLLKYRDNPRQS